MNLAGAFKLKLERGGALGAFRSMALAEYKLLEKVSKSINKNNGTLSPYAFIARGLPDYMLNQDDGSSPKEVGVHSLSALVDRLVVEHEVSVGDLAEKFYGFLSELYECEGLLPQLNYEKCYNYLESLLPKDAK